MLFKIVFEPCQTAWAAPIVFGPKKDGSLCFCVEYWKLDAIMKKNVYLIPRMDDFVDSLSKATLSLR